MSLKNYILLHRLILMGPVGNYAHFSLYLLIDIITLVYAIARRKVKDAF